LDFEVGRSKVMASTTQYKNFPAIRRNAKTRQNHTKSPENCWKTGKRCAERRSRWVLHVGRPRERNSGFEGRFFRNSPAKVGMTG
jgi:hypothetical protein